MARHLTMDLRMYRHSGIGRYLRNLVPALLPKLAVDRVRVVGRRTVIGDAGWLHDLRVDFVEAPASIYSVAEQRMALQGVYRGTNLLWVPHYNVPFFYQGPMVVTMHDVAPLAMPEILGNAVKRNYARWLIQRAVKHAAALLCVSEFTAGELRSRLGVPAVKITVTYPGLDVGWPEKGEPHIEADGVPYLLYVGNVKPNKNLGLLLRAFAAVLDRTPYRLVLAGRMDGFGTNDDAVLQTAKALGDRVRLAGEVSDAELVRLYAGASAFVLPSLYEGFGLPLLEAMKLGCPVLCSTAGSLPEVAGDAALYFHPYSESALAELLLQVGDEAKMDGLRKAGLQRVQIFGFEQCAALTAGVMNRMMEGGV